MKKAREEDIFFSETNCEFSDYESALTAFKESDANFSHKIKNTEMQMRLLNQDLEAAKVDYPEIPDDEFQRLFKSHGLATVKRDCFGDIDK
jgi:hypothetical protein